jgi:GTP cyclohydrolase I
MLTKQDEIKRELKKLSEVDEKRITNELLHIESFAGHENKALTVEQRAIMTKQVSVQFMKMFDTMKLDYKNDPNLIDTPMRIASMWVNELHVGRYQNEPRMEQFPKDFDTISSHDELIDNDTIQPLQSDGMLIVKKVDIRSLCSHHFMPFLDENSSNSYGLIAYKPTSNLIGISKLQRIVNFYGSRPQLQENLTYQIYKHVVEVLGTPDVMVSLHNIVHTCESLRGVESVCGRTGTLQYGGYFNDPAHRNEVLAHVK